MIRKGLRFFVALMLSTACEGYVVQYNPDGYDPYFSANMSITKEFGDHVSLSLYVNNFTFSRQAVVSYATGVAAIFTPDFYYGMSVRIRF